MADTICALATAAVEAGIGIIRLSGDNAVELVSAFVRTKSGKQLNIQESHRVKYGFVCDGEQVVDEVLVLTMRGPRSYTGEDTVEIDCHGGILMLRKILEICVKNGARPAEPGEFTKRAFLNGRIDLAEAEAVSELISARSEDGMKASLAQLRGAVSEKIRHFRSILLEDDAYIEAALDDPEHISLDGFTERLQENIKKIQTGVRKLLDTAEDGRILREGVRTVILGKPNAGKSSLLNALIGEDRAIVTSVAGTTRDTLEEQIQLRGVSLLLVDTAGIRETDDIVEKIGVERAMQAAADADLILYVVDASAPLNEDDVRIMEFIRGKKAIVLLNKMDLPAAVTQQLLEEKTGQPVLPVSMKNQEGLEALSDLVQKLFEHQKIHMNSEVIITSARHTALLRNADQALTEVLHSIEMGLPEDFYTIDLMRAYTELGYILGEEVSEDLVNEIFSKFCMGK